MNNKNGLKCFRGYFRRFWQIKQEYNCLNVRAWRILEDEYFALYDEHRYSTYGSFREAKWRYNKIRKQSCKYNGKKQKRSLLAGGTTPA